MIDLGADGGSDSNAFALAIPAKSAGTFLRATWCARNRDLVPGQCRAAASVIRPDIERDCPRRTSHHGARRDARVSA